MGLDMYLIRKKDIGKARIKVDILENKYSWYVEEPKEYEFENATSIEEEVGYWRKANAVHKYFVDTVQEGVDDCKEYWVSYEQLEDLLDKCKEIKEKCKLVDGKVKNGEKIVDGKWEDIIENGKIMTNIEVAEELLPTASGFFFGSTDYDEYYMQDIDNTIEIIENILKDKNGEIYYKSSW